MKIILERIAMLVLVLLMVFTGSSCIVTSCNVCSIQKHCFVKCSSSAQSVLEVCCFLGDSYFFVVAKISRGRTLPGRSFCPKIKILLKGSGRCHFTPSTCRHYHSRLKQRSRGERGQASKTQATGDCYLVFARSQVIEISYLSCVEEQVHPEEA